MHAMDPANQVTASCHSLAKHTQGPAARRLASCQNLKYSLDDLQDPVHDSAANDARLSCLLEHAWLLGHLYKQDVMDLWIQAST